MITRFAWQNRLGCLLAAVLLSSFSAAGHALPISYLRLVPAADYLHLEFVFNPFELTFMPEVDENKDNELSPAELAAHGEMVAERVIAAWKVSVDGKVLDAETAGMDPDLNGHHVRLRAHYKVDARGLPLTVESDFVGLTSGSHLTQVTCASGTNTLLAQLDAQSRRVTFLPPAEKRQPTAEARKAAAFGGVLMLAAVLALLVAAAGLLLFLRRRIG